MDWYIGSLITVEDDPENNPGDVRHVPAADFGNGLVEYTVRGSRMHCQRTVEGDVLIGVPVGRACPDGWAKQTTPEAITHFTNVKGRAPLAAEVF